MDYAGNLIASFLHRQGVQFLFTLCGGHISPILVGAKQKGIRVVDVRDEVTAVFAADAVARLTGIPGVAAVTAGPGLTNTITAVKNAQMAQSPVVIFGGATATMLKGRGSLQDIDQMALMKPHTKLALTVKSVREILPKLEKAFVTCQEGIPGPVFIEIPVDLLYAESVVRDWYGIKEEKGKNIRASLFQAYLKRHVKKIFSGVNWQPSFRELKVASFAPRKKDIDAMVRCIHQAQRPVMLVGSQATLHPQNANALQQAIVKLGIPTYLSGMARGLLGKQCPLQLRHRRRQALKESDLVILVGVPCDFRMNYGRHIPAQAKYISINRSAKDLRKNRVPDLGVLCDPGNFLLELARFCENNSFAEGWLQSLKQRDAQRDEEISHQGQEETTGVNPLHLFQHLEKLMSEKSIIVADGGDFVATASYILRPQPLSWLDPGAFGTLGVGAGFALGAKLCRPDAEVWIVYGDGSVGYSLCEWDTFVRHNVPVIAVVGNDACWSQIAREQVQIFADDVGTVLEHSSYEKVVAGFGAEGLLLDQANKIPDIVKEAQEKCAAGKPVLINAIIGKTDFRKGSISI
ncbi:thiamine pyrophosphate-binding protein [Candidatus Uabimicrobium amorphum]|uniref:Acetolactate synthase n=1 Tax=Uabimicrobium amorphum TaxID=2596890 RepID=A0A5S9ITJ4_UABAM|nr:thiamine pyrophosphate-binding protein [Candidatus Uabimicrobium amorphum]BBM87356.1 acetolactate synthase [Candidatus Uabimicrobium amorphum]